VKAAQNGDKYVPNSTLYVLKVSISERQQFEIEVAEKVIVSQSAFSE
jgi:hypothetical protein